jgi:Ca2+-transporting ATPase
MAKFAGMALRCLGFAYSDSLGDLADYNGRGHKAGKQLEDPANFVNVEQDLTWVGLVAMQDPPRAEVRDSMAACKKAGVRVIVITGDNQITAEAICRDIGVFEADENITGKSYISGEFRKLSKDKQKQILLSDRLGGFVFSRAEPKDKQDIVRMLKDAGDVVAMTGDGVNDAPALKMADIGIAMGIAGTEVAKEASDFVLADDNFATIVGAVEEGRSIYENMKAFIRYMISSNVGEVMSIFFVAALGLPEGMVPVQLLWVNLVTDGPPATALGFNKADPYIMEKPPRDREDPLINNWVLFRYLVVGLYVGFATVGAFVTWFMHGVGSEPFLGFLDLSEDGHTSVTWEELTNWGDCDPKTNMFDLGDKPYKFTAAPWTAGGKTYEFSGCEYFDSVGKRKASTLSLTVLVTIEMANALNALSENGSLLVIPPWDNPYLIAAMILSFVLHFVILYIPSLCPIFEVVPLSKNEWILVLIYSLPVILLEELLKIVGRVFDAKEQKRRDEAWAARIKESKKSR